MNNNHIILVQEYFLYKNNPNYNNDKIIFNLNISKKNNNNIQ